MLRWTSTQPKKRLVDFATAPQGVFGSVKKRVSDLTEEFEINYKIINSSALQNTDVGKATYENIRRIQEELQKRNMK